MEEKYLKKLTPKQQDIYNKNIDLFIQWWSNNNYLLHTHSLTWNWKWYNSFTCLRNSGRDVGLYLKYWNEIKLTTV